MFDINTQETIFDEFWDPALSTNETYKLVSISRNFKSCQLWCWFYVYWEAGENGLTGVMEREESLEIKGFSELIVCASVGEGANADVYAVQKDNEYFLGKITGKGEIEEYFFELPSNLEKVYIRFYCYGEYHLTSGIFWLWNGLRRDISVEPNHKMNSLKRYFNAYLLPDEEVGTVEPMFEFLFDKTELKDLKKRLHNPLYEPIMENLREKANEFLEYSPEKLFKNHVWLKGRAPDFARVRDRNEVDIRDACLTLSFVGLVDENIELTRHAWRFGLILMAIPYWRESFLATYPMSQWRHLAFTESLCMETLTLLIDFGGVLLKPKTYKALTMALYHKGVCDVERVFLQGPGHRMNNPALVFIPPLLMSNLVISHSWVYYYPRIRQTYRLFNKIIKHAIKKDGGGNKPPLYWNKGSIPPTLVYLITLQSHKNLSKYLYEKILNKIEPRLNNKLLFLEKKLKIQICLAISLFFKFYMFPNRNKIRRIIKNYNIYFTALFDSDAPHPDLLPVGDRTRTSILTEGIFILARIMKGNNKLLWQIIAKEMLTQHPHMIKRSTPASIQALLAPIDKFNRTQKFKIERITDNTGIINLKKSGFCTARRKINDHLVRLTLLGLPKSSSHRHEDVGSIILQVENQDVFLDRGSLYYGDPIGERLKKADYHNMLTPNDDNGQFIGVPHDNFCSIKPIFYKNLFGDWKAKMNLSFLWPRLFKKYIRSVIWKKDNQLNIFENLLPVSSANITTHWHTPLPFRKIDQGFELLASSFKVQIKAKKAQSWYGYEDLWDEKGRKINHLFINYSISGLSECGVSISVVN